jgi:hypothetical protein
MSRRRNKRRAEKRAGTQHEQVANGAEPSAVAEGTAEAEAAAAPAPETPAVEASASSEPEPTPRRPRSRRDKATQEANADAEADREGTGEEQPTQEPVPPPIHILVESNLLLAAASCCSTEEGRAYLGGVYIHAVDDGLRFVGTDGHRMLVISRKLGKDEPQLPWMKDGILLPAEHLKARLAIIGKVSEASLVKLSVDLGRIVLADIRDESVFRLTPIDAKFPDYRRIIAGATSAIAPQSPRADLRGTAFDGKYLKGVGDIAKILSGDKEKCQVNVMSPDVADGQDGDGDPSIITFPYSPGAVMYLMPQRLVTSMAPATAAILQPAIKSSIAALKAHETRNRQAAKAATNEAEREQLNAIADDFKLRVARILATASGKALPAPEKKPDGEAKPEAKTEAPRKPMSRRAHSRAAKRMGVNGPAASVPDAAGA